MKNSVINEWNKAAETYSKLQSNAAFASFNREFVKTLTTDIRGCKILDAGCGDGYYSNYLQQQGANVIGCDGSSEMIRMARTNYPSIQFDIVDLQEVLPYRDQQFDMVFCNMVLMDIEQIDILIAEVSRVLKDNGTLLLSILHPGFVLGYWEFDKTGRKTYRKIANYIKPRSVKMNYWGMTTHYHRPLSFYLNLLSANNLLLDKMYEPPIPTKDIHSRPKLLTRLKIALSELMLPAVNKHIDPAFDDKPFTRIPLFLFARFLKH